MKVLNPNKVFAQYRDNMNPYNPVTNRKYTITHSDETADLFVFIGENYADDQFTRIRDDVNIAWEKTENGLALIGFVLVDEVGVLGNPFIRNKIFYNEMPTALQALRQADRFLFINEPGLDKTPVYIQFISNNPNLAKTYSFGEIGNYK